MKNVYVLAAVVVLFGGVLVGCTKDKKKNVAEPAPVAVEEQMNDDSLEMKDENADEEKSDDSEGSDNEDQMDKNSEKKDGEDDSEGETSLLGGEYLVDVKSSVMNWTGSKVTGSSHSGTLKLKSGNLSFEDGKITSGEFMVDMNTMLEGGKETGAVKHLKNEDFFDVEKYSFSKFVVTSSEKLSNGDVKVTGNLTIKDQTHPVTFTASITESGNEVTAKTSFSIDRTKWGVRYGSGSFFDDLGNKAIKDNIDYSLEIVALKK